jgi:hypothetical protein
MITRPEATARRTPGAGTASRALPKKSVKFVETIKVL